MEASITDLPKLYIASFTLLWQAGQRTPPEMPEMIASLVPLRLSPLPVCSKGSRRYGIGLRRNEPLSTPGAFAVNHRKR
jgi:hypothetical protein